MKICRVGLFFGRIIASPVSLGRNLPSTSDACGSEPSQKLLSFERLVTLPLSTKSLNRNAHNEKEVFLVDQGNCRSTQLKTLEATSFQLSKDSTATFGRNGH